MTDILDLPDWTHVVNERILADSTFDQHCPDVSGPPPAYTPDINDRSPRASAHREIADQRPEWT